VEDTAGIDVEEETLGYQNNAILLFFLIFVDLCKFA